MSPEDAHEVPDHTLTKHDGSGAILNAEGRVVGERGMVPNRHTRRANARATRSARNPHPGQRLPIPAPLTDPDWQRKAAEAKLPQLMARQIDAQRRALARARKESLSE